MEDEDWLLKKIRTWGLPDPEILNGLFLKVYDANMATLNWPPLSYPETAPLLVHVPGYHGESEIEWSMRLLRKIGIDMHNGYTPRDTPPPYTPDMTNPLNPFERSWLSDPMIREAFAAIRSVLVNPPAKYANRPVNNSMVVHGLIGGSRLPSNDDQIFTAYTRENTIYEDTICSQMSIPARFYGRILGSSDFDTFYAKVEKRSKEYDVLFLSNSILPEKLTRKGLAWDQQLFTVIGPSIDPHKDSFHVLSRTHGGSASVPVADTVWIQMTSEPASESSSSVCTIQGAYMSIFKPFLWLYYNGVHSVSPSLLEMLKGTESDRGLFERRALQTLIHPLGSLSVPFTLTGKRSRFITPRPGETFHNVTYKARSTDFSPLMSNLKRLRKTLKKRSWSPWSLLTKRGPEPSKLVNEFIERYSVDLTKTQEIRDAATALQKQYTTANKDALIQALKDAIRKYKKSRGQLPLDTYTGMHDKPVPNLGGTDYSVYNSSIQDLETEMAKPWYSKTWGKSSQIIKSLLETYLELFSDKGDLNVVNALLALKKLKSQDAIAALKKAIETRRYTVRGLPTPAINSEGPVRRVAFPQTIRDERARLDPNHEPVERRGRQPWEIPMDTVRIIPELPLELPKPDPISVRKAPAVRVRSAKTQKQKQRYTNFRPPVFKQAFTNMESDGLALIKASESNMVTVPLPTSGNTVKVPLGQAGGFSPSLMGSFVTNGLRLMPAAAYLGYKQINRKTLKTRKTRKTQK